MAQFICPSCGSKYFLTSKTGPKNVLMVGPKRALKFIQLSSESIADDNIDTHTICCGACSWQGDLDELVESLTA